MKYLSCKDIGRSDCNWECRGGSISEVMEKVSVHSKELHGLTEIPSIDLDRFKTAIREV